ncbi:MAG: formylglycine-generating enzyme family protein [Desulfovibrionaceae bacterium]|nr:formylglycine-generating enzyme family protein [Desulfovibrionaceae bacterium]
MRRIPLFFLLGLMIFWGIYWDALAMETRFSNNLGMEFILIPAGEFQMGAFGGSYRAGAGRVPDAGSGRLVKISRPFYLGRHEVTQAQWMAVMGENPSYTKNLRHPVESFSWEEAQEFISRLNHLEGRERYRLPTEAEWEYAARAGSKGAYSFGNDPADLAEYAWYDGNAGKRHHQVGRKKPNAWGLYDMQGNVWEFTQDWYSENHDPAPATVDPKGPEQGRGRVARGGCYGNKARGCRLTARLEVAPQTRNLGIGLRLACQAE